MTGTNQQAANTIPQPARVRTAGEPTSRSYPRAQPVDNLERRVRVWPCAWAFEDGRLLARNDAGAVVASWLADCQLGQGLALLLNQAPAISRLLLSPWLPLDGDNRGAPGS